jgi:hypothetical protein
MSGANSRCPTLSGLPQWVEGRRGVAVMPRPCSKQNQSGGQVPYLINQIVCKVRSLVRSQLAKSPWLLGF